MNGALMRLVRKYGEVEITQRDDGYLDATALCRAAGKEWKHYWENDGTKAFVEALSLNVGIPTLKLIVSKRGKGGGTWVHPQVAMHLGQWLSPEFSVLVSRWVIERLQEESDPDLAIRRGKERAVEAYRRQGYPEAWIHERVYGKEIRKEYTEELKAHGCVGDGYARCTNSIYEGVLGGPCKTIKALKGLQDRDNLRDHLTRRELTFTRFAEELATMRLDYDQANGNEDCIRTSQKAGRLTKSAIDQMMK